MAKHNRKGRSKGKEQHVRLTYKMIESAAFRALQPEAIALYIHVAHRYQGGDSNGNIAFSTREAATVLKMSKNTAAKLFNELVEKGFLKIAQGSCFNFKHKKARRWELTQWPLNHGVAPSNDWLYWRPKNS